MMTCSSHFSHRTSWANFYMQVCARQLFFSSKDIIETEKGIAYYYYTHTHSLSLSLLVREVDFRLQEWMNEWSSFLEWSKATGSFSWETLIKPLYSAIFLVFCLFTDFFFLPFSATKRVGAKGTIFFFAFFTYAKEVFIIIYFLVLSTWPPLVPNFLVGVLFFLVIVATG